MVATGVAAYFSLILSSPIGLADFRYGAGSWDKAFLSLVRVVILGVNEYLVWILAVLAVVTATSVDNLGVLMYSKVLVAIEMPIFVLAVVVMGMVIKVVVSELISAV